MQILLDPAAYSSRVAKRATNWRPGYHLSRFGINFIDRLYVTNFDEDHVSGFPNLSDYVRIGALSTNPTVAPSTVRYLKSEDGMGVGIERLAVNSVGEKQGSTVRGSRSLGAWLRP